MKVLGITLSLASMLSAGAGLFTHQNGPGLIFSVLVGCVGLRVFLLWLGTNRVSSIQKPIAATPLSIQSTASLEWEQKPLVTSSASPVQPVHTAPPYYAPPAPSYAPSAVYPQQAVHRLQSSNTRPPSTRKERQVLGAESASPYAPIDQDPIFEFDRPVARERCFILPKEGEPVIECQDNYALDAEQRCYAVADGVAGSFLPGPWARIIAKGFVEHGGKFADKHDFQNWLVKRSKQWHAWIEERWVPTMNMQRERNGEERGDWRTDISQGAQTTLIGCSLVPGSEFQDVSTTVNVFAVGDGEFFLFSPNKNGEWEMVEAFPYFDPDEFGSRPDTLVTVPRADLMDHAWMQRKTASFTAFPGDLIVLATDTLAKWLLTQVQQRTGKYIPLLTSSYLDEFERCIRQEFHHDHVEDDDVTMLIIPIS